MKSLEKFLTDLPKPDVEVPAFRDQLRRELLSASPRITGRPWRFATVGLAALAGVLVAALGLFVARPEIPADLHAVLTGTGSAARESLNEANIQRLLGREGSRPVRHGLAAPGVLQCPQEPVSNWGHGKWVRRLCRPRYHGDGSTVCDV